MNFHNVLITGGAGFVGSNLAIKLKQDFPKLTIVCFDNLKRRGSELTLPRLKANDIQFIHGDIRNTEDLESISFDLLIECSAEPSVLAGITSSPTYLLNTNLIGTINCLESARKNNASLLFLSTSRVYPIEYLNQLLFEETPTRYDWKNDQPFPGASERGIAESFPLDKARSLYGTTKLASELLIQEYEDTYKMPAIINRCGVITGPWQMGKVDQGVFVLWVAKHYFKGKLSYIGFGGEGKQVRDFLHIDDLYNAIKTQLNDFKKYKSEVYNIGGGKVDSVSLQELTALCQKITGNTIEIEKITDNRPADIRIFITDSTKFAQKSEWKLQKNPEQTITDIFEWIHQNERILQPILA